MSTTSWLVFDVTVNNGNDPDGQVQLTYSIVSGVLQGSAVLDFRPNSNANGHALFTTPSTATATGVTNGSNTVYTLTNIAVNSFNLPPGQVYQGGQYDTVDLTVTVASDGTATLSGQFSDPSADTPCDWTAQTTSSETQAESQYGAQGAGANA